MTNLITVICECGQHATGTPQELREKHWNLDANEWGDDFCPECPKAKAIAEVNF